jgi:hypothetical protein
MSASAQMIVCLIAAGQPWEMPADTVFAPGEARRILQQLVETLRNEQDTVDCNG